MVSSASTRDYSLLDHPSILHALFHPRPALGAMEAPASAEDFLIPAGDDVVIGARLHRAERSGPVLLFFHGNGEIVDDYDDLAPLYIRQGISLFVVDYRGYGRSTGTPSSSAMMRDCHVIFDFVTSCLAERGLRGPLVSMGRSLGSASALEVAARHADRVAGLVIDSGFAHTLPRLRFRGIDPERLSLEERDGFGNLDKIRSFHGPTLVIHGERDRIIDCAEGQALHEASPAERKRLLVIPGADHNNLLLVGMDQYMEAIATFCAGLA